MNFIRRFFLHSVDTSSPSMQAQIETSIDQVHDDVEVLEPYGLTSSPPEEIEEGLSAHVQGHADHGVIMGFFDKLFRPKNLLRGEVVLYNKWGGKIELFEHAIKVTHTIGGQEATITLSEGTLIEISCETFNVTATNISLNAGAIATLGTLTNNGINIGSTHVHAAKPPSSPSDFSGGPT